MSWRAAKGLFPVDLGCFDAEMKGSRAKITWGMRIPQVIFAVNVTLPEEMTWGIPIPRVFPPRMHDSRKKLPAESAIPGTQKRGAHAPMQTPTSRSCCTSTHASRWDTRSNASNPFWRRTYGDISRRKCVNEHAAATRSVRHQRKTRRLTVGYKPLKSPGVEVPYLRLHGRWLVRDLKSGGVSNLSTEPLQRLNAGCMTVRR